MPALPLTAWLLAAAVLAGCASAKPPQPAPGAADASRTALDWAGAYEGTLPCADCPGIRTTLELRPDQTYRLTLRYLERSVAPLVEQGRFRWDAAGGTIELQDRKNGPMRYRVGENQLVQLDRDGQPITGPLAPSFVLRKAAP